jgi:putative ABC transport system permease protein
MKTFLSIAWRNVLRNKKRSMITIFAIGFGLMAMIFMWGIYDGLTPLMIDNMTNTFMGHMEISTSEYVDKNQLEFAITDGAPLLEALTDVEGLAAFSPRLQVFGLLSYAENSRGGAIIGIDPEMEAQLGRIDDSIEEGGRFLSAPNELIIGSKLAENLGVGLGDEILIVTSNRFNNMSYLGPMPIVGLVNTGVPEFDSNTAFVDRKMLAEAVFIDSSVEYLNPEVEIVDPNQVMTSIAIKLERSDELPEIAASLGTIVPENKLLRTWKEIAPWVDQSIALREAFGYFLLGIVLIIVIAGILNTVLMSVMERTREFGIMRALGTKGRQIFLMVSMESIMLGVVGIVIGSVAGLLLNIIFNKVGLNIYGTIDQELMGQFYMLDPMVYPQINLDHFLSTCLIILISVVLISLYPARKASKMEPVNAIKTLG